MAAYQGKEGCTNPGCTRIGNRCMGWHCSHCDGPSNIMAHCRNKCAGSEQETRELDTMVEDIRSGKLKRYRITTNVNQRCFFSYSENEARQEFTDKYGHLGEVVTEICELPSPAAFE